MGASRMDDDFINDEGVHDGYTTTDSENEETMSSIKFMPVYFVCDAHAGLRINTSMVFFLLWFEDKCNDHSSLIFDLLACRQWQETSASLVNLEFPPFGVSAAPPSTLINLLIKVLFPHLEFAANPIKYLLLQGVE
ncbi:hypothetical protein M9H77_02654 [Catharanthus roseus]|uniref:Uncharacterized protein n=1 Tax=Catharanthus roseus TaxID=4058 RepID=A0ACC0C931_CATRO|nr:hypothetical protein M9H77_02654 [Catharanthus roseus]